MRTRLDNRPPNRPRIQRKDEATLKTGAGRSRGAFEQLFACPQRYRDNILRTYQFDQGGWGGQSYVVVYPTKFCPVGCEHCYFASPKPTNKSADSRLNGDDARIISSFLDQANTEFLQITGAGEPLLELNTVLNLIRKSHAKRIDIHTSAVIFNSIIKATEVLEKLFAAFQFSRNDGRLTFRISIDEFHIAKINDKATKNAIAAFRQNYAKYTEAGFYIKLHSLVEDDSISQLLAQFKSETTKIDYESKNEYGTSFSNPLPTKVTFQDRSVIHVDYAHRMLANATPDMNRVSEVEKAVQVYDRLTMPKPGLFLNQDGQKGLCFIIHEDGNVELWNTALCDNMPNVRTHSFKEVKNSVFSDVIQVAALENGYPYVHSLLKEVNPLAIRRAKAIGSAANFNVNTFVEAKDRLYVSIRVIQDFLAAGRVDAETRLLDPIIQSAIELPQQNLKNLYFESNYGIIDQYLDDPNVTVQNLVQLYKQFELGHFGASSDTLVDKIRTSGTVDESTKAQFAAAIC